MHVIPQLGGSRRWRRRRPERGKAPEGTVSLTASHRSGRVVMRISNNGAGP